MDDGDRHWAILDAAPDATIVVDSSGRIVHANPRTKDVLGWLPHELVGNDVAVLVPADRAGRHAGHLKGFHAAPKSRMMGVGLELEAVRRDGSTIPVEIALSPHEVEGERLVIASVRDISERLLLTRELNATSSRLAVVDERDRIARDLHDRVIQRLFAAGLRLQASLGRPDQDERVAAVIDEIDEAIKEIRTTIFTMHSPRGLSAGCEHAVRIAVGEAGRVLGHQPRVEVHGPTAIVPDDLVVEVVAVVRELLSNVAKHAQASATTVTLDVTDSWLTLHVLDDGVGFDPSLQTAGSNGGQGLRNLADRARRRGGTATFEGRTDGGTRATWTVPLD